MLVNDFLFRMASGGGKSLPPAGVMPFRRAGKVRPRILPMVLFQQTQNATPISLWDRGKHSAA